MAGPKSNKLPDPHPEFAGRNNSDATGNRSFPAIAKKWLPRGVVFERLVCTVARYANRLIDRKTGKAFSANELATDADSPVKQAIDAAGAEGLTYPNPTTISAFGATLIDDADSSAARTTLGLGGAAVLATSTGGNGASDSGKAASYGTGGRLSCSFGFYLHNSGGGSHVLYPSSDAGHYTLTPPLGSGTLALTSQTDGSITTSDVDGLGTAAVLDASDGSAATRNGKAAKFSDAEGTLTAAGFIAKTDYTGAAVTFTPHPTSVDTRLIYGPDATGVLALTSQTDGSITAADIADSTAAGRALLTAADASAQLAALGIHTYADLTAANAALNAGDIYFDTALGVCRVATG